MIWMRLNFDNIGESDDLRLALSEVSGLNIKLHRDDSKSANSVIYVPSGGWVGIYVDSEINGDGLKEDITTALNNHGITSSVAFGADVESLSEDHETMRAELNSMVSPDALTKPE